MEARLNMFVFMSLVAAAMLHASSAQTTHVVGDDLGWLVPPGGEVAYRTWAATKTFVVGDVLVFNFTENVHTVAKVSKEAFDSCNTTNPISLFTTSPTNFTLTAGEHHFICTAASHCSLGQKLAINVTAANPPPVPTPESAPSPAPVGSMTYTVGDGIGWLVPPGGPLAYQTWARGKSFVVGDILVFNFTNREHNVLQVTKAEFDACNVTTTTTTPITDSPARISLTSAGEHYYMCTFPQHCFLGQKLAINVTGGGAAPAPAPFTPAPTPAPSNPAAPTPAPSSPAAPTPAPSTPPPTSATPPPSAGGPSAPTTPATPAAPNSDVPPPPPDSSAASAVAAAWPFTFVVAAALAFLYN